ncbi:cobinamide adenolsyltransferase [candidate division WOR-1 bacterium DG_54_3]|jgi:cob(I)alamin adenosyltransferase|uniref:Cobinamide adenolsyltransferase n=1 Tax=candidate division WOR-1 bacterium DG_54_3 TaxID=1703775 RepID=A0A0S7Y4V1_UNCSA|nr:MAG: cobinamide adenolsyltransferase [candidate division WOR-1 bacterium DG_54_3]
MIYLFTGEGGGKTIAALGLALRSIGHKRRVVVIQFMKGRKDVGEYKAAQKLAPYLKVYQFGRKGFVNPRNPSKEDKELAQEGFEFAKQILRKKPNLLILDEINLALAIGLLDLKEVLKFLRKMPKSMDVVLTGRRASTKLYRLADGVSVVKKVKHVFDKGVPARKGIEY